MKYFTEREFSGIFSLAGGICVFEKGIPGGRAVGPTYSFKVGICGSFVLRKLRQHRPIPFDSRALYGRMNITTLAAEHAFNYTL